MRENTMLLSIIKKQQYLDMTCLCSLLHTVWCVSDERRLSSGSVLKVEEL